MQALATTLHAGIADLSDAVWAAHAKAHKFKFQLYDLASFCAALIAAPRHYRSAGLVSAGAIALVAFTSACDATDQFYDLVRQAFGL